MAQAQQNEEGYGQRSPIVRRLLQTRLGRSMAAYYGEQTAGQKAFAAWDLGGPYWGMLLRIRESPEFLAKMPKDIRIVDLPGKGRQIHPLDIPKFTKWMVPAVLAEAEKHPKLGEELRAKEPALRRFVTDCITDPRMWVGVPELKLVGAGVSAVAGPIVRAIERRPTAARWLLTPGKRIAQLRDEELMSLWYGLRGRLGLSGRAWRASAGQVKGALRGLDGKQVEEVGRLLQETRDLASYSAGVRAGKIKPASSNAVIEAFVKGRRLLDEAFMRIPHRTALPGSAEEVAAMARVRAAGGAAKAGKGALKPGEYRLMEELQEVRKGQKLIRRRDRATGVEVTAYRRGYYGLPAKVRPGAAPLKPGARVPRARRPREAQQPVVARSAEEVRGDLRRMIAREPEYAVLRGIQDDLARAFARSGTLADPVQQKAALEVFRGLEKRLGEKAVKNALTMLDHLAVTRVKHVYTLYNPAWYFKNFIDSVWLKNLLAGVPPVKLHKFMREAPRDVYGNPVEVGVTWTKELTGLEMGEMGQLARVGNWVENTARRALWDDTYWKGMKTLRAAGQTVEVAHRKAGIAAMRAVGKVHFDYGDLSKTDEVMRRIIPFWMYQRNQLRWMAEQAVMRPRAVYGGYKFFELGEKGEGPATRLPGLPTLQVQAFAIASPVRFMKTISGVLADDERERKRWEGAGPLGRWIQRGEKWGFYIHPAIEQGFSALLKGGDLMDDKSWKGVAPLASAVGKMLKVDLTYLGVWRTMFPEDRHQPRMGELQRAFKRRVMMRRAFSMLEGREMSLTEASKYVGREMEVAGLGAVFGLYPKVREPKYDEMQRLLEKRRGLSYADRQEFDRAHPEVGFYLMALSMKGR